LSLEIYAIIFVQYVDVNVFELMIILRLLLPPKVQNPVH